MPWYIFVEPHATRLGARLVGPFESEDSCHSWAREHTRGPLWSSYTPLQFESPEEFAEEFAE